MFTYSPATRIVQKTIWVFIFAMAVSFISQPVLAQKKAKPDWQSYESKAGKFKAKFPSTPEVKTEDTDTGKRHKAMARFGNGVYFATFMVHDTPLAKHFDLAKTSLVAFNDKLGGTIKSQNDWEVKGHKGLQATINIADKGSLVEYRVVLVGQIQYQLIVVYPENEWDAKTTKKFFKKFKLKA